MTSATGYVWPILDILLRVGLLGGSLLGGGSPGLAGLGNQLVGTPQTRFITHTRYTKPRGVQRDVIHLGWPIAPAYLGPNAEGEWGLSQWVQLCTGSQNKLWRSISIQYLTYAMIKPDTRTHSCKKTASSFNVNDLIVFPWVHTDCNAILSMPDNYAVQSWNF